MKQTKVLNNVVIFSHGGKDLKMRFSDDELRTLRHASIHYKGDEVDRFKHGELYNFAAYAMFDYEIKSPSKRGRFCSAFPYHSFSRILWQLET